MKPRMRSRKPASIGSNQASPANSPSGLAAVVLSLSMAWSPPARQRRALVVESQPETTSPHFQPHPGRDPATYVGTQAGIVLIMTMVQGNGPPLTLAPGVERFVGIFFGLLIVMLVVLVTHPPDFGHSATGR